MIQSISRAFEILEYIAFNGNFVGPNDIADAVGLKKTTVHNFLNTLKELGYIEQDELTPRYRITYKFQCLYSPDVSLFQIWQGQKNLMRIWCWIRRSICFGTRVTMGYPHRK